MAAANYAVALLALVATAASLAPLHVNEGSIEGKYIVVFKENSSKTDRDAHMEQVRSTIISADSTFAVSHEWDYFKFHAYAATMSKNSVEKIRQDDNVVDFVEAEQVFTVNKPVGDMKKNVQLFPKRANATKAPANACLQQTEATWGLVRTSQRDLNIDGIFQYESTEMGTGVDVYIIDTGIYLDHVEFEGRAIWGTDTVDNPSPETDSNGHGTHVAGTVMSREYGVAKGANAIAVKVLGASGSGSTAGVIAGVDWTCSDHQSKRNKCVANMSLGGGLSTALNRAVEAATQCGCSMAVASGNDASNACLYSPASAADPVMTVNSMTSTDSESYFSNHGTCTNLYAPGSSITSTWIGSPYSINTISGTSMASPHVAGVMAALASRTSPGSDNPESIAREIIQSTTDDVLTGVNVFSPNKLLYKSC